MWDQTDGCANHYRCSIAYYLMSFLSKSYQIVLDRDVDTLINVKDVAGGFSAVQKLYLATCLKIHSTPEVENINSKHMRVDVMTEKVEVRFDEECNLSLDLRD